MMDNEEVNQFDEDNQKKAIKNNRGKKKVLFFILALFLVGMVIALFSYYEDNINNRVLNKPYKGILNKKVNNSIIVNKNIISKSDIAQAVTNITKAKEKMLTNVNQNTQRQIKILENTEKSIKTIGYISETQKEHEKIVISKLNQIQTSYQKKINGLITSVNSLINVKKQKTKQLKKKIDAEVFELVAINLWDFKPQATIRFQDKISIVDEGSIRMGWKILNIDFDKEQIIIIKNGQKITLEKIK